MYTPVRRRSEYQPQQKMTSLFQKTFYLTPLRQYDLNLPKPTSRKNNIRFFIEEQMQKEIKLKESLCNAYERQIRKYKTQLEHQKRQLFQLNNQVPSLEESIFQQKKINLQLQQKIQSFQSITPPNLNLTELSQIRHTYQQRVMESKYNHDMFKKDHQQQKEKDLSNTIQRMEFIKKENVQLLKKKMDLQVQIKLQQLNLQKKLHGARNFQKEFFQQQLKEFSNRLVQMKQRNQQTIPMIQNYGKINLIKQINKIKYENEDYERLHKRYKNYIDMIEKKIQRINIQTEKEQKIYDNLLSEVEKADKQINKIINLRTVENNYFQDNLQEMDQLQKKIKQQQRKFSKLRNDFEILSHLLDNKITKVLYKQFTDFKTNNQF